MYLDAPTSTPILQPTLIPVSAMPTLTPTPILTPTPVTSYIDYHIIFFIYSILCNDSHCTLDSSSYTIKGLSAVHIDHSNTNTTPTLTLTSKPMPTPVSQPMPMPVSQPIGNTITNTYTIVSMFSIPNLNTNSITL